MADQQSMQAIVQALGQMNGPQQGGVSPDELRMRGPGFGMTGPGVPVNPIPGPMPGQGTQPGATPGAPVYGQPTDYRAPAPGMQQLPRQFGGQDQMRAQLLQNIMNQNPGQFDFLNGLLGSLLGGQTPPAMGQMPPQPGVTRPPMPTPGYPGGPYPIPPGAKTNPGGDYMDMRMRGPGFGMTGPGVPVDPVAGPGGAFGNARTTQPVMNQPQMPTFGGSTKRPF